MNPYQSPAEVETTPYEAPGAIVVDRSFAVQRTLTAILLAAGGLSLLLLNGQPFTNALICLTLFGISGLVWLPLALSTKTKSKDARYVIVAHVVLMLAVASFLPSQYEFQKKRESKLEEMRARVKASQN